MDQALGARLAALDSGMGNSIIAKQIAFSPEDRVDLKRLVAALRGEFAGVIGCTSVTESTALGESAEDSGLLCFVANNNTAVWNGKRNVFHIGIPSAQTAEAVAARLATLGIRRVRLLHDETEFQRRAASSALAALQKAGVEVDGDGETATQRDRAPDLFYLLYSDEEKALALARRLRGEKPLLFGRSLLRESFISALGADMREAWFVDLLPRTGPRSAIQERFMAASAAGGVRIPTANHCFGWDAMALGCRALLKAAGVPRAAIDDLESGIVLEGAAGSYRFDPRDHNGRSSGGPTLLSRWREGRVEEIV